MLQHNTPFSGYTLWCAACEDDQQVEGVQPRWGMTVIGKHDRELMRLTIFGLACGHSAVDLGRTHDDPLTILACANGDHSRCGEAHG